MGESEVTGVENDLKDLLVCVKCHQNAEKVVQEALKTVVAICANHKIAKDLFRDLGGLQFLLEMLLHTRRILLLESCMRTLACMMDENVYNQKQLTKQEVFELIHGILNSKRITTALLRNVVYFSSALLFQNSGAQILIQKSECLEDFISLYERLFPDFMLEKQSSYWEGKETNELSIEIWLAVNAVLSFSVNNPHNEFMLHFYGMNVLVNVDIIEGSFHRITDKNQRICCKVLPLALKILQCSSSCKIINAVSSFLSVVIANNVHNQDLLAKYDGIFILQQFLQKHVALVINDIKKYNPIIFKGNIQCAINVLEVIDVSVSEHRENAKIFGELGGVTLLLKLMDINELKEEWKTNIIITLGHSVESFEENCYYILEEQKFPEMLKKIMLSGEKDLLIACKYLLFVCVNKGEQSGSRMSNLIANSDKNVEICMESPTRRRLQMRSRKFGREFQVDTKSNFSFPVSQPHNKNIQQVCSGRRPFQQKQVLCSTRKYHLGQSQQDIKNPFMSIMHTHDKTKKEVVGKNCVSCNTGYCNILSDKKNVFQEKEYLDCKDYNTKRNLICSEDNNSCNNSEDINIQPCKFAFSKTTFSPCQICNRTPNCYLQKQCKKCFGACSCHSNYLSLDCCSSSEDVIPIKNILQSPCSVSSLLQEENDGADLQHPEKCQGKFDRKKCILENCAKIHKHKIECNINNINLKDKFKLNFFSCSCNCHKENPAVYKRSCTTNLTETPLSSTSKKVLNEISSNNKNMFEEINVLKEPLKIDSSELKHRRTPRNCQKTNFICTSGMFFNTQKITPSMKGNKLSKGRFSKPELLFSPFRKFQTQNNLGQSSEKFNSDAFSVNDMMIFDSMVHSAAMPATISKDADISSCKFKDPLNFSKSAFNKYTYEFTAGEPSSERKETSTKRKNSLNASILSSSESNVKPAHSRLLLPACFLSPRKPKRKSTEKELNAFKQGEDIMQIGTRISSCPTQIEVVTFSGSTCVEHNLTNSFQMFQVIELQ